MTIEQAGLMLADAAAYTDEPRLHQALALLRREAPVHLVRAPGYDPFYAVTRHADVMRVERDNALWLSEPRPVPTRTDPGGTARSLTRPAKDETTVTSSLAARCLARAEASLDPASNRIRTRVPDVGVIRAA